MRTDRGEDFALDRLVLDGALDHQIAHAEILVRGRGGDLLERVVALCFGDLAGPDLAGEIAVDGGEPRLHPLLAHIVEKHLEARKGTYMGDTVAHLTGANDADFFDLHN